MIDPNKVIKVRPMIYSQEDIEDFKIQINELMQMNLIRENKSPHSSPAFMVRESFLKRLIKTHEKRLIQTHESHLGSIQGNLAYSKLMFTCYP